MASLGSRSGTGRTNKRLFTWVWPCCTTRVSQKGSTHFAESGEPINSSRRRGRSPQIGGVFIGFEIRRRCVRAGNKRTIDLLSSVDFEVQVRRDHLARAIRTIEKGLFHARTRIGRAVFGDAAVDPPGACQVQRTASEANSRAPLALLPVFILLLGIGELSKITMVIYSCAWPLDQPGRDDVRRAAIFDIAARSLGATWQRLACSAFSDNSEPKSDSRPAT